MFFSFIHRLLWHFGFCGCRTVTGRTPPSAAHLSQPSPSRRQLPLSQTAPASSRPAHPQQPSLRQAAGLPYRSLSYQSLQLELNHRPRLANQRTTFLVKRKTAHLGGDVERVPIRTIVYDAC